MPKTAIRERIAGRRSAPVRRGGIPRALVQSVSLLIDIQEKIQTAAVKAATSQERDEYFEKAAEFIIDKDKASIASLQRVFKIGFNRAARLMDQLCEAGIVGEEEGTKPRKVLMSEEQFEQYKEDYL